MLIYPPPPDPLYYYMIPTLMHSKQEQIGRRARNCGEGQDPPLERRGPAGGGGGAQEVSHMEYRLKSITKNPQTNTSRCINE